MENLKFRAFHKSAKIMCDVLLICFVNRYVSVLPEIELEGGEQQEWSFDEIDLIQYAGKLGKEEYPLWEGDIVHVTMNKYGKPTGNGFKAYIKFNHHTSSWQYCYFTAGNYWGTNDIKGEFINPTGRNIYEHPDFTSRR